MFVCELQVKVNLTVCNNCYENLLKKTQSLQKIYLSSKNNVIMLGTQKLMVRIFGLPNSTFFQFVKFKLNFN